jgi:hypothetical protein
MAEMGIGEEGGGTSTPLLKNCVRFYQAKQ